MMLDGGCALDGRVLTNIKLDPARLSLERLSKQTISLLNRKQLEKFNLPPETLSTPVGIVDMMTIFKDDRFLGPKKI